MSTRGALAETDDPILVAMVLGGNQEAFAAIYDRYADRIHDFGYSMLRNSGAAAELTSVTFEQAARRIHQLGDNRPLYPWLYNLARGEAMSRLGGHTRVAMTDDLDPATQIIGQVTAERIGDHGTGELTGPTTVLTGPTSVIPPARSDLDSLEFVAPPTGPDRAAAGAVAVETDRADRRDPAAEPEAETEAETEAAAEPVDPEAAALETMLRSEAAQRAQIWHAVTELPDADRALLDLHLRHSLEGAALGQAMGRPPDEVYARLNQIRVDTGRPLGAWLLAADAKAGELTPCPELTDLLRGWDGGYGGVIRKKVVRHIDVCTLCQTRHKDLPSPWGLYASVPPVLAPSLLRGRVLARAQYAAFAEPEPRRRRLRPVLIPAAALAAIAAAVAATVLLWPGDDSEERATGNAAGSSDTGDQQGIADLPEPLYLLPPPRTPGAPPPAIIPGASRAGAPAPQAGGQPGGAPGVAPPGPAPVQAPPPPDTTVPTVGAPHLDSAVQFANIPVTIRVSVTDASPLSSVTVYYLEPGGKPMSRVMSRDGDTWTTWAGPYCGKGVIPAYVTATDIAGNTATGPTSAMPYLVANC